MSFVAALGLLVGVLVVAPYLAHRLRRRRADERPFAAAHLVMPAPPRARRRAKLEDRALFATRSLAVLALAVLGASPLVRCSRLALQRSSGASVALAIIVDDSMSMRARVNGSSGPTRFARAKDGARELMASAREGDAVAIVLAGAPARVALAATTDLRAARAAIDALAESDRATDLDGAVTIGRALVSQLPQVDRRVVVLSDLADGQPDATPIGEGSALPVWAPLPELRGDLPDCGVLAADRAGARVRVRVACGHDATTAGREVVLTGADGKELVKAPAPSAPQGEASLTLAGEPPPGLLTASLTGGDAIASDDAAPVVTEAGPGAIAVIAESSDEAAATGGAPIVEQALAALKVDVAIRPIPVLPDRSEDLASFVGVILDDPPGFTPEQRHALGAFLDDGGVVLLALGPRAAAAPLGATLQPILDHAVTWTANASPGAKPAGGPFGEAAASLVDLAAQHRATLSGEDVGALESLVAWQDSAPLIGRRTHGRGESLVVTLPFGIGASDLTLRPGFLGLLDAWVERARLGAAPRRGDVGVAWTFSGARDLAATGPVGPMEVARDGETARVVPPLIGAYSIQLDARRAPGGGDKAEVRVAAPPLREIDLRPRRASPSTSSQSLGDTHAAVDVSWAVALVLLALTAAELVLRLRATNPSRPSEEFAA